MGDSPLLSFNWFFYLVFLLKYIYEVFPVTVNAFLLILSTFAPTLLHLLQE